MNEAVVDVWDDGEDVYLLIDGESIADRSTRTSGGYYFSINADNFDIISGIKMFYLPEDCVLLIEYPDEETTQLMDIEVRKNRIKISFSVLSPILGVNMIKKGRYFERLSGILGELKDITVNLNDIGAEFILEDIKFEDSIKDAVRRLINKWMKTHEYIMASLDNEDKKIDVSFHFPEQIATSCEQYLLYFVEFLKEAGIKASTSITRNLDETLFSINPDNKHEALERIKYALDLYLKLPVHYRNGNLLVNPGDLKSQELFMQVERLSSQVNVSMMMLQAQQATIKAQEITIATQQRILDGEVFLNSVQNVSQPAESVDEESILGGTVILSRAGIESTGVQFNLAELLRKVRNWRAGGGEKDKNNE